MEGFITSHGNGTRSRQLLGGHQWNTWSSQALQSPLSNAVVNQTLSYDKLMLCCIYSCV